MTSSANGTLAAFVACDSADRAVALLPSSCVNHEHADVEEPLQVLLVVGVDGDQLVQHDALDRVRGAGVRAR